MRNLKWFLLLALILVLGNLKQAFAENLTVCTREKIAFINENVVKSMSKWLDNTMNHGNNYTNKTIALYFDPHVVMIVNGKIVAKNSKELQNHFRSFPNNTSKITHTIRDVVAAGDKVVQHLTIDIIDIQNKHSILQVIVIYTLKNAKIIRWEEVFSTN